MSARVLSHLAIAALVVLGTLSVGVRYWARYHDRADREHSVWRLSYNITFQTEGTSPERTVRVAIPSNTPYCALVSEEFILEGMQESDRSDQSETRRESVLELHHAGEHVFNADFELRLNPRGQWLAQPPTESLSTNLRSRYLRDTETIPVRSPKFQEVLQQAPSGPGTQGERLQWIFKFCSQFILPAAESNDDSGDRSSPVTDDATQALLGVATPLGRARAMVALCRASRMPARLVAGFELKQSDSASPHVWVEVYQDQLHAWVPFDPTYGYARYIPVNMIAVRQSGDTIVRAGDVPFEAKYSISRLAPPESVLTGDVPHPTQIFDLTRLPLEMHEVIKLMLLLPLAAMITAIFRNVIGIQTFGTFSPALLALSFIYAAWGTGLVILTVVICSGLFGRTFLEKLHLLMVPRLSVVLTAVILFIAFGVSFLDHVGVTPSAQAVLLPMVILTNMIERVYVCKEEDGAVFAMQLAVGTIIVATFCYLALRWDQVGRIILVYPELHFFTIAGFIMIGRYAGYRITELWRFRDLVK